MDIIYYQPVHKVRELIVDKIDNISRCWVWNQLHDFYMEVPENHIESIKEEALWSIIDNQKLNSEFLVIYLREGKHPEEMKQFFFDKKIIPQSEIKKIVMLSELGR